MANLYRRRLELLLALVVTSSMMVLLMFLKLDAAGQLHSPDVAEDVGSHRIVRSDSSPPRGFDRNAKAPTTPGHFLDQKYLLPLIEYNWNGPGWWMGQMRHATQLAMHFHRTVAMVPMKTHYRDTPSNELVPFNSTFDGGALSRLLPVVTLDNFKRLCGRHICSESLVIDPFRSNVHKTMEEFVAMYEEYRSFYEENLGILLPNSTRIPKSEEEYQERLESLESWRCVAVYHPNKIKIDIPDTEALQDRAAVGLAKAPYIRELVDRLEKKICGGEPYLAMHWRNKTGESCIVFKVCKGDLQEDVQTLIRLSPNISDVILAYMKSMNLSCMYVAHPTFEQQILVDLKAKLSAEKVISQGDIMKFSEMAPYVNATYVTSLIEQEICFRSKVFLPWFTWGSWSAFVSRQRRGHGRVSRGLAFIPGMPKEALVYKWPY